MHAQEIGLVRMGFWQAALCLRKKHIFPNLIDANRFIQILAHHQRIAQLIVAEVSSEPCNLISGFVNCHHSQMAIFYFWLLDRGVLSFCFLCNRLRFIQQLLSICNIIYRYFCVKQYFFLVCFIS